MSGCDFCVVYIFIQSVIYLCEFIYFKSFKHEDLGEDWCAYYQQIRKYNIVLSKTQFEIGVIIPMHRYRKIY